MPYKEYNEIKVEDKPSDFMKLKEGLNTVRITTKVVFLHETHRFQDDEGKFKIKPHAEENCQLCLNGNEKKQRYAWIVLDREDGKVKILDVGWTIFKVVHDLSHDPDYGNPTEYDLKITKTGQGLDTEYSVIASPKRVPLTEDEEILVAGAGLDLEKIFGGGKQSKPLGEVVSEDEIPDNLGKKS